MCPIFFGVFWYEKAENDGAFVTLIRCISKLAAEYGNLARLPYSAASLEIHLMSVTKAPSFSAFSYQKTPKKIGHITWRNLQNDVSNFL